MTRNRQAYRRGSLRVLLFTIVGGLWSVLGVGAEPAVAPAEQEASSPKRSADEGPKWQSLFDGETLDGWKSTNFGGEGEVEVRDGTIILPIGSPMTGITWKQKPPQGNYELELEANRLDGHDFFCGLTFPVRSEEHCSLIIGGWGGGLVGISSIDGRDASENRTTIVRSFESKRWYKVRIRVTDKQLQAWIDDESVVDESIEGHQLSTRPEVELSKPLGIAAYSTRAAIRNIRWRPLM